MVMIHVNKEDPHRDNVEELIDRIRASGDILTNWEEAFLYSCLMRVDADRPLTHTMWLKLKAIYKRTH